MSELVNYLNNASSAIMSESTLRVYTQYLNLEAQSGASAAAAAYRDDLESFYTKASQALGTVDESQIAFVDSASRAWDAILYGLKIGRGDEILTLSSEFGTNLVSIYHFAEKSGCRVKIVDCDINGVFSLENIKAKITPATKVIALSHVAAHGSIINPVEAIGQIARDQSIFYLVDGCQAVGQIPVNVHEIQCDAYTGTGRKWIRGPRGTGFLYSRHNEILATPFVDLASADLNFSADESVSGVVVREDARQFELWERNAAGQVALANALSELQIALADGNVSKIYEHGSLLREEVDRLPHLRRIGTASNTGNVAIVADSDSVSQRCKEVLTNAGVSYSAMQEWDAPIFYRQHGIREVIRLSPHYFTSIDEIEAARVALKQAVV